MSQLMPPGWTWHTDPQGRIYYYHAPSGVSQWHPPPPLPAVGGSAAPLAESSSHIPASSDPGRRFIGTQRRELKIKEVFGLLTDNFDIVDTVSGQPFFRMQGTFGAMGNPKVLLDVSGAPIYVLSETALSLRGRMNVQDATTDQVVLTMRKKSFIPMMGANIVQGWRGATDQGEPWIEIKGNFFQKQFTITELSSQRVIATVARQTNLMSILLKQDSYILSIEPGVDCALMTVLVVALDDQHRQDQGEPGMGGFMF